MLNLLYMAHGTFSIIFLTNSGGVVYICAGDAYNNCQDKVEERLAVDN